MNKAVDFTMLQTLKTKGHVICWAFTDERQFYFPFFLICGSVGQGLRDRAWVVTFSCNGSNWASRALGHSIYRRHLYLLLSLFPRAICWEPFKRNLHKNVTRVLRLWLSVSSLFKNIDNAYIYTPHWAKHGNLFFTIVLQSR